MKINFKLKKSSPPKKIRDCRILCRARIFLHELLYRSHLGIRYLHDIAYQKYKPYKKYSDLPISAKIHKATLAGFLLSFIVFTSLQVVYPYYFSAKPRDVTGISLKIEDPKIREVTYEQWQNQRSRMKDVTVKGDKVSAKIYASPVQYETVSGEWEDIDTTIERTSTGYEMVKAPYQAYFFRNLGQALKVSYNEHEVSSSFVGAADTSPTIQGNIINYPNAYAQTDVERIFGVDGIKQNIILKGPGHPTEFKEKLQSNLRMELQADNSINYYKDDALIMTTPPVTLIDADGVTLKPEINFNENILTVNVPDTRYLSYPITIDPANSIYGVSGDDTYVEEYYSCGCDCYYEYPSYPTGTTLYTYSYPGSGSSKQIFSRFLISGLPATTVATLYYYPYSGTSGYGNTLYHMPPLNPGTDQGATLFNYGAYSTVATTTTTVNTWLSFNVTSNVNADIDNTRSYSHFKLEGTNSTTYGFYSNDSANANKPYLYVETPSVPTAPTGLSGTPQDSSSILWSWTDASSNETGFTVHDASNNNISGNLPANTTQWLQSGLSPNTSYGAFHVHAFSADGTSAQSNTDSDVTLPIAPDVSETSGRAPDNIYNTAALIYQSDVTFGAGTVQYYRYVCDQVATHTWTGSETQWTAGTVSCATTGEGNYYIHLKPYNSADVASSTLDYGPIIIDHYAPTISSLDLKDNVTGSNIFTSGKVKVSGVFNDLGGLGGHTLKIQFSENGTDWGLWNGSTNFTTGGTDWAEGTYLTITPAATEQTIDNSGAGIWNLSGTGSVGVYTRMSDGNSLSGDSYNTRGDFSTATLSNITVGGVNDSDLATAKLSSSPGTGGNMMLFWEGSTAPDGWSFDTSYEGYYIMGAQTAGTTGGQVSHSHSFTYGVVSSSSGASCASGSNTTSAYSHSHTISGNSSGSANNLPSYRNLRLIKYNNGIPAEIPQYAIAMFDDTIPSGWTSYTLMDGKLVRIDSTSGGTGGSTTHNHDISATLDTSSGSYSFLGGTDYYSSNVSHTHSVSSQSANQSSFPPYTATWFAKASSSQGIPAGIIAMFDAPLASDWTSLSDPGGLYFGRFLYGNNAGSYGTQGGLYEHTHSGTVSSELNYSQSGRCVSNYGGYTAAGYPHAHTLSYNSSNSYFHYPPYKQVIIAKKNVTFNTFGTIGGTDAGLRYGDPGGLTNKWGNLFWEAQNLGTDIDANKIKLQVRAGDNWGSGDTGYVNPIDGTASYYEINSGSAGSINLHSSIVSAKTFEIRAVLEGDGTTETALVAVNLQAFPYDAVVIDNEAPNPFELTSPADGTQQGGSPTFTWQATTDVGSAGMGKYQLYINGELDRDDIPPDTTSATPTSPLSDGNYSWYIKAVDNYGNVRQSTSTWNIVVDATGPIITDNQSGDDTWRHNSGTYNIDFSDPGFGLLSFETKVTTASAYGGTVIQDWTKVADLTGASYTTDWALLQGTWDLMQQGTNYVYVRATDAINNVSTSTDYVFYVKKDTVLPTSAVTTNGYYGSTENPWPGSISGTASDTSGSGVQKTEIMLSSPDNRYWNGSAWTDQVSWVQATGTTAWSYSISYTNFSDSVTYTINSRTTDVAGNIQETLGSSTFSYDSSSPVGSVVINAGATYITSTAVSLAFPDTSIDVDKIKVSNNADLSADGLNVGSGSWVNFSSPMSWSFSASNGTKMVYVKFKDLAGNESLEIYNDDIILDVSVPVSSVSQPGDEAMINSLVEVSGTVVENGSGFTNKNQVTVALINGGGLYWNGVMFDTPEVWLEVTTLTGELPDYTWTYTTLPNFVNGNYQVKVKAIDDAGNTEIPAVGNAFIFDNTPPVISSLNSSTHPDQDLWLGANDVAFAWSANDAETGNTAVTGYSYAWDSTSNTVPDTISEGLAVSESYLGVADGLYYFHLRALDGAGNWSDPSHFTVRIDSTAPVEGTPSFAVNGIDDSNIDISFGRFGDLSGPDEYKIYRATVASTPTSTSSTDPNIDPTSLTYNNLVTTITDDSSESYSYTDSGLSQGWYYYVIYVTDHASPVNTSTAIYSHSKTNYIPNDITLSVNGGTEPITIAPDSSRLLSLAWSTTDPDGQADIITTKVTVKRPDGTVLATYDQGDARMVRTSITNGYSIVASYTLATGLAYGNYTIYTTTIDTIALNAHVKDSNIVTLKLTPDAPRDVMATGIKSTQINITWTAPVISDGLRTANRYELYRKLTSEDDTTYQSIGLTGDLIFINTGLEMGTGYTYKVRAFDVSDNAGYWSVVVTASPPAPVASEAAAVKDASALSIDLGGNNPVRHLVTWNVVTDGQVPDFRGYKVYRETSGVWEAEPVAEIDCDALGYNQAYYLDLHPASDSTIVYRYKVATWDEADNVGAGTETLATGVSLTPTITSQPQVADRGVSWIRLTWSTDQSTKSLVQYKKSADSTYSNFGGDPRATEVQDGDQYVNSVTIGGLDKGTSYDFKVQSLSSSGFMSTESNKLTGETKPFNINYDANTGKVLTSSGAEISWNTGEVASEGYIEYKQGNTGETKVIGTGKSDVNHQVNITGLIPGDYVFTLKNIDADGNIATSNLQSFTITGFETGTISAPQAGKIEEQDITATSAKITWTSSVPTSSWIDYGTTSNAYTKSVGNDTLTIDHVLNMDGLTPGETYYYIVRGIDANGVEYKSKEYSFIAIAKPGISLIEVSDVGYYTATIRVEVTKDVRATISYGKDGAYNLKAGSNDYAKVQVIKLENLEDGSNYSFTVDVVDAVGNTAKSDSRSFETPIDRTGPKVEGIKIDIMPLGDSDETAQAIISWRTDKPSTTLVEYDVGLVGGQYTKSSIEDESLSNTHTVIIKGLEVASTYHYRIIAKDKRNNKTTSNDYTFVTPEKNKSIWQLIVRSLEETFSWVKNIGSFFSNLGKKAN